MLKHRIVCSGLVVLAVFLGSPAFSESVQGIVTYLDSRNKMIGIRETPTFVKPVRVFMVKDAWVVEALEPGQQVRVDTSRVDEIKPTPHAEALKASWSEM